MSSLKFKRCFVFFSFLFFLQFGFNKYLSSKTGLEIPYIGVVELSRLSSETKELFGLKNVRDDLLRFSFKKLDSYKEKIKEKFKNEELSGYLLDRKVSLTLENLVEGEEILFKIDFSPELVFSITPWKRLYVPYLYLRITSSGKEVFYKGKISQDRSFNLSFGTDRGSTYLKVFFEYLSLSNLIKGFKGSSFDQIALKNVSLKVKNIFKENLEKFFEISAVSDFSNLKLPLPVKLSAIPTKIKANKNYGLRLYAYLPEINLSKFITLKDSFLDLTVPTKNQSTNTTLGFSGEFFLTGPFTKKEINAKFDSEYKDNNFNLQANLLDPVSILDLLTFNKAVVKISTNGNLEIIGNTNLFGMDFVSSFKLSKFKQAEDPSLVDKKDGLRFGNYRAEFLAKGMGDKEFKIFKNVPGLKEISFLKNVSIKKPEVKLASDRSFVVKGQANLFNFVGDVLLKAKGKNISLLYSPPEGWKLSNAISKLEGTFFDDIDFSSSKMVISSYEYQDLDLGLKVKKGINFISDVDLKGKAFDRVKVLTGKLEQKLRMVGAFGKSLTDADFEIYIPLKSVKLSKKVSLQNISLILHTTGPSMGLKTQILVMPSEKDSELLFSGEGGFDLVKPTLYLKGTMEGKWENPLGVKVLSLEDLAVELAILLTAPVPVPERVGLAGTMFLGERKIKMATKVSDTGDFVLFGEFDGQLGLRDLLYIPIKLTPKVKWDNIKKVLPDFSVSDLLFKVASRDTTIGELNINSGLTFKGILSILNKKGMIEGGSYPTGLLAKGFFPEIKLGPFNITRRSKEKAYSPTFNGPMFDLALTRDNQHFIVDGAMKIFGLQEDVKVYFKRDQILFYLDVNFLNKFKFDLLGGSTGKITDPKELDFIIKGELKNDFTGYVSSGVASKVNSIKNGFSKKIKEAQKKINDLNKQIAKLDKKINSRKTEIEDLKTKIIKDTQGAKEKIDNKADILKQKREELSELDKEIKELEDKKESLFGVKKFKIKLKIAKLKTEKKFKELAFLSAEKFLRGISKISFNPKNAAEALKISKLATEIAGLQVAKGSLIASRETAKNSLKISEKAFDLTAKTIEKASGVPEKIFDIKTAFFNASTKDFIHGKLPKINMDCVLFGRDISIKLDIDLSKKESLKEFMKRVIDGVRLTVKRIVHKEGSAKA